MQKINYFASNKPAFERLMELENLLKESTIDATTRNLVRIYASQLNGCAFCVDMHSKEAKIHGERELRLYHIPVWHESPLFTDKEKAALQWTKAVTQLSQGAVSDETYQSVKKYFNEKEMTDLTLVIGLINVWNRFGAPFASTPGGMDKVMGLEKAGLH